MKNFTYFLPAFFLLQGCNEEVQNKELKDKMLACTISMGSRFDSSLKEHIDKNLQDGQLSLSFAEGAKDIFDNLSDIPPEERIKLYEDYINCIKTLTIRYGRRNVVKKSNI